MLDCSELETILTKKCAVWQKNSSEKHQAPVVRRVDNTIHWINLYKVDNSVRIVNAYPLDSDLFVG